MSETTTRANGRRSKIRSRIHGDETTVQVLKEEGKEAASLSYMWAYCSAHDSEQPIVLFDYQPGRGQIYPQTFLGDYRGILMSDGYSAWRTLESQCRRLQLYADLSRLWR